MGVGTGDSELGEPSEELESYAGQSQALKAQQGWAGLVLTGSWGCGGVVDLPGRCAGSLV